MGDGRRDSDCIFCKIVAGQIPSYKLYEDDAVLAFLDVGPLSQGHALVVPKSHHETLATLPASEAGQCMEAVVQVGLALREAVGFDAWNVLQNNGQVAGQVVPHVHFHIIPRAEGDGLGYRWPAGELDKAFAERVAGEVAAKLGAG